MSEFETNSDKLHQLTLLRKKIESCLTFGPSQSSASIDDVDTSPQQFRTEEERLEFWRATKHDIDSLQISSKNVVAPIFQGLRAKCDDAQSYLSQLTFIEEKNTAILDSFSCFVRTEYKIQLLTMVKLLKRLDQSTNILDVPEIILQIKDATKMTILEKSKIYQFMCEIIRIKKAKLLQKFHKLFEEHLDSEISTSTASGAIHENELHDKDIYDDQKQIWRQFLQRSRQWLLSYAMVSILPSAIINSPKMVIERFKEALDEAMTPLWGRFYHHLKMGRESYSKNQILWTFKYAASFIEMLHGLCAHITAADEMKQVVHNSVTNDETIDFRSVAKAQVLEKALKFLNAHLASIFVLVSTWEDVFGMQLVDEILEFDTWLSPFDPPSYLCHILYDSKTFFHHWLLLEQSLIYRHFDPMGEVSVEPEVAFARKFQTPLNPASVAPSTSSAAMGITKRSSDRFVSTEKTEVLQCYNFLYDALQLFLLAQQRYAFFPPAAQFILSEIILEPLLCLSLGFCLYKIRCDPLLFSVSMGQSHAIQEVLSTASTSSVPESLALFRDSVAYFQTTLDTEARTQQTLPHPHVHFIAQESRCKKRWTIVQEWLPKLLLTKDLRQQGYAVRNLVKTALKVSDKYRNHQNYAYRNQWFEFQQQQGSSHRHQPQQHHNFHHHHHQGSKDIPQDSSDLEACIVMTRGLAITMADVLEEQWQILCTKQAASKSPLVPKGSSVENSHV